MIIITVNYYLMPKTIRKRLLFTSSILYHQQCWCVKENLNITSHYQYRCKKNLQIKKITWSYIKKNANFHFHLNIKIIERRNFLKNLRRTLLFKFWLAQLLIGKGQSWFASSDSSKWSRIAWVMEEKDKKFCLISFCLWNCTFYYVISFSNELPTSLKASCIETFMALKFVKNTV